MEKLAVILAEHDTGLAAIASTRADLEQALMILDREEDSFIEQQHIQNGKALFIRFLLQSIDDYRTILRVTNGLSPALKAIIISNDELLNLSSIGLIALGSDRTLEWHYTAHYDVEEREVVGDYKFDYGPEEVVYAYGYGRVSRPWYVGIGVPQPSDQLIDNFTNNLIDIEESADGANQGLKYVTSDSHHLYPLPDNEVDLNKLVDRITQII